MQGNIFGVFLESNICISFSYPLENLQKIHILVSAALQIQQNLLEYDGQGVKNKSSLFRKTRIVYHATFLGKSNNSKKYSLSVYI